jgi:hypothetical protein
MLAKKQTKSVNDLAMRHSIGTPPGLGLGLFALSLLSVSSIAFADTVKARKDGVRLFSEASSTAKVIRVLKKDELLNMRHRFGSFFVVDEGKNGLGYVRALETIKAGDKEADAFRKTLEERVGKVDPGDSASGARARASTSVMGIRGLADDGDASSRPSARHGRSHSVDTASRLV